MFSRDYAVDLIGTSLSNLLASGSNEDVAAFVRDVADSPLGEPLVRRVLETVEHEAERRGDADLKALAAKASAERDPAGPAQKWLLARAGVRLAASGRMAPIEGFLAALGRSPASDEVVADVLEEMAEESGRQQKHDVEKVVLAFGARRFKGSVGYQWRAARAAHRAGDYVLARSLAPAATPPQVDKDRRVAKMLKDFEALRALPREVTALTDRPRPYAPPDPNRRAPLPILYSAHNAFPYSTGGYATRTHGLVRALLEGGAAPVVAVRPAAAKTLDARAVEDVQEIDGVLYKYDAGALASGRFSRIAQLKENCRRNIAREHPAVVQAASNFEAGLPAVLASAEAGLPVVYEVRGFWEVTRLSDEPEFFGHPLFRRNVAAEIATCLLADHVATLNDSMKALIASWGVPEDDITVVPNSAPTELFDPRPRDARLAAEFKIKPDDVVIGYVGSFLAYEGLEDIVEAFDRLAGARPNLKVLMVGDHEPAGPRLGDYARKVANRIAESPFRQRIILSPRVPYDRVPDYYSLIDVCPFPRRSRLVTELVTPMKPNEALSMAKAVAVSSVGGLKGLVTHGETGMVFEADSVDAITECLAALVDQPELRRRLGEAGRQLAATDRSWAMAADKLRDVYDRLLDQGGRHRDPQVWREAGRAAARFLDADGEIRHVDEVLRRAFG